MKLSKAAAYATIEGRKTVERRPYRRGKNPNLKVGGCIPVVIVGSKAGRVATVRVTWFERERLGDSETVADCLAEGFGGADPVALRKHIWEQSHGPYDPDREVWAVKFELVSVEKAAVAA